MKLFNPKKKVYFIGEGNFLGFYKIIPRYFWENRLFFNIFKGEREKSDFEKLLEERDLTPQIDLDIAPFFNLLKDHLFLEKGVNFKDLKEYDFLKLFFNLLNDSLFFFKEKINKLNFSKDYIFYCYEYAKVGGKSLMEIICEGKRYNGLDEFLFANFILMEVKLNNKKILETTQSAKNRGIGVFNG